MQLPSEYVVHSDADTEGDRALDHIQGEPLGCSLGPLFRYELPPHLTMYRVGNRGS